MNLAPTESVRLLEVSCHNGGCSFTGLASYHPYHRRGIRFPSALSPGCRDPIHQAVIEIQRNP